VKVGVIDILKNTYARKVDINVNKIQTGETY